MKWLTGEEVRAAAKKSKRAAIACAKKHWWQNHTATEKEMRVFAKTHRPAGYRLCALCWRYNQNNVHKLGRYWCPLKKAKDKTYCCNQYTKALRAFTNWKAKVGNGRYSTFTKKAKAMYDRICEL